MRRITILLCLFLLTGCSSIARRWEYRDLMKPVIEEKMKNPNLIVDGKPEPEFPDEDKNEETLGGIDSNNDGIRDDVEIWINRSESDDLKRKALKKLARFYQSILTDNTYTLVKARKLDVSDLTNNVQKRAYEEWESNACLFGAYGADSFMLLDNKINVLVFNFKNRANYASNNHFLVSRVSTFKRERLFEKKAMYCY